MENRLDRLEQRLEELESKLQDIMDLLEMENHEEDYDDDNSSDDVCDDCYESPCACINNEDIEDEDDDEDQPYVDENDWDSSNEEVCIQEMQIKNIMIAC